MADLSGIPDFLLSSLGTGSFNPQARPWTSYGGINTKAPITVIQQLRGHITNTATSMLGPMFGPVAGYFASNWLVGQDFNRTGTLHNNFSGLLAPAAGTYANAFQSLARKQTLSMLETNRDNIEKNLRSDFFTHYYSLTMGKDAKSQAVQSAVAAAEKSILSIPSAFHVFVDPSQSKRALQGIKNTQAGLLYWQSRMDPLAAAGLETGVAGQRDPAEMAKLLGTSMQEMVKDANAWALGKGKNNGGYGGFNGASVAELASILQNSANQLDLSGVKELGKSLEAFGKKVRQTSQALAPLKDIFGQDVKAMTDMIQSVSGQSIAQLSPTLIKSIASNTADMARYSGATVAQMAAAGQSIFLQSAQFGGTSFSRIGAANSGAFYSGLIAQGNAPAGVHAAEYAGNTKKAVASSMASQGTDRAAMAYAIWKDAGGVDGDTSVAKFLQTVQSNRGAAGSMQQAILNTINKKGGPKYTWGSLVQGLTKSGYSQFLMDPRAAQLGISQQYKRKLATSIKYLGRLGGTGVTRQQLSQLGGFMMQESSASAVKDLVTNYASDPAAVARFMRKQMAPLQAQGTGAWLSLWRGLSNANDLSKLNTKDAFNVDGKKIGGRAILAHMRSLFGTGSNAQAKTRFTRFSKNLGEDAASILAMANGQYSKDQTFIDLIQKAASADKQTAAKARAQLIARKDKYLSSKMSEKTFQGDQQASNIYKGARDQYTKALEKAKTEDERKAAGEKFQRGAQTAYRLKRLKQLSNTDFGWQATEEGRKKEALKNIIKDSGSAGLSAIAKMSEEQFRKSKYHGHGLSLDDIKRAERITSSSYDRKTDIQRLLITVLERMQSWFDNNKPQNKKSTK